VPKEKNILVQSQVVNKGESIVNGQPTHQEHLRLYRHGRNFRYIDEVQDVYLRGVKINDGTLK
jgi:hypothetical protein